MSPTDYKAVRVGMNVSESIKRGDIDGGIGLENVQMVELEEYCKATNRPSSDVKMLRIDELAELGCCCFCSILYIANQGYVRENPEKVRSFMRAIKKATDFLFREPEQAWKEYKVYKKVMEGAVNEKIFEWVQRGRGRAMVGTS